MIKKDLVLFYIVPALLIGVIVFVYNIALSFLPYKPKIGDCVFVNGKAIVKINRIFSLNTYEISNTYDQKFLVFLRKNDTIEQMDCIIFNKLKEKEYDFTNNRSSSPSRDKSLPSFSDLPRRDRT